MASSLLQSQSYNTVLNQSFKTLLDSLHTQKATNFSDFTSIFHQLLQSKPDPPLESIWVYSRICYLTEKSKKNEVLEQFGVIKECFQLIVSCSGSCSSLKCVVLIAPVVYKLVKFVVSLNGFELGGKRLKREVKGLVGSVLGYLSVCCEGLSGDDLDEDLIRPLSDLVSIWVDDKEGLVEFFPLLSDGIVEEIGGGACGLSELAGFVVAETFMLKLCVEIGEGELSKEGENQLRSWIIGSITGLKNTFFFRTLLMMLLEPSLPVTSLMDHRAQALLRKILYDAVILVEYTFLGPEKLDILPIKHVKGIAMSRLLVIHEAVESFRKEVDDQTKVISYLDAFSSSSLPSQLIKWVSCESGIDVKATGLNGSTPKAFLRWILNLENRGVRIFDDALSKFRNKLILDNLIGYPEEEDGKSSDADNLFYIDKKGVEEEGNDEDEDMTSVNAAFVSAAQTMQASENGGTKRKTKNLEKQQPKYHKHGLHDVSSRKTSASVNDDSSSDSDVDDPSSDDDMEA